MHRRAPMSFVIEVKRGKKRFTQGSTKPSISVHDTGVWNAAAGAGGLFVTAFSEGGHRSGPTVDAARVAADSIFTRHSSPASARVPNGNDLKAQNLVPARQARPDGLVAPRPAADPSAARLDANAHDVKPRTGRILQSLTSEDPVDAMLRQKAEELAARRRLPRGPRVRSAAPAEPQAAIRRDNSSDPDPHPELRAPRRKVRRKKNKVAKRPRSASRRRTVDDRASAKRRAPEVAARKSLGKKAAAGGRGPKRSAGKSASKRAVKSSGRKTAAKRTIKLKKSIAKKPAGRIASRRHSPPKSRRGR